MGLPGFHSKNLAKQTGSGQATEGDSRPKALPGSREPGPECGRTRSSWDPIPGHPRTSASCVDPYATALLHTRGKQGPPVLGSLLGPVWTWMADTKNSRVCFVCKTTCVSSLLLCSCCPSFTGTQALWSPFQNSWPLWAQHVDTRFVKSMLLEHERRQQAGAGPPSGLSPASATGPSGALVGSALCPLATRSV